MVRSNLAVSLPAAFLAAILIAACGGDDDGRAVPTPTARPAATPSPSAVPPSATPSLAPPSSATPTATETPVPATATEVSTATATQLPTATATEGPSALELLLSVPESASYTFAGLSSDVHVVRTEADVPHIYASNRHDLAFAQGFVLARDRYVMMELSRRLSRGEISALLGDDALAFDVESRGMGMAYVAERIAGGLAPELAEVVDAFAAGFDAYIAEVKAGHLPLPSELKVAGPLLGAPNPADLMQPIGRLDAAAMIATIVYQTSFDSGDLDRAAAAAQLDGLYGDDVPFAELRRRGAREDVFGTVGPTIPVTSTIGFGLEIEDRFEPGPTPPTAARQARAASADSLANRAGEVPRPLLSGLAARLQRFEAHLGRNRERGFGSNAWAVAGNASKDGSALLAGDGHLQLSVPSIMFQLGLDTRALGGGDIHQLGITIPGLPIMIVGTNGSVAWSQTQLFGDSTDFYREEIELGDDGLPSASRFRGASMPLVRIDESYEIADVPALGSVGRTEVIPRWTTFDGRWLIDVEGREVTDEAPAGEGEAVVYVSGRRVVPGDLDGDGTVTGVSFDYAGFDLERIIDGPDGFGRSADVAQFRAHSRSLIAFSQNIVAADSGGHIFYSVYHAIPCRSYLERTPSGDWADGANPLLLLDGTRYGGFTVPTIDGIADESAGAEDPYRCVVPFDATPQAIDPARGYVFTSNNDPAHIATDNSFTDDPWYIGGPWDTGWRGARVDQLLAETVAAGDADVARMSAIQGDHKSPLCGAFVPWLSEAVNNARALEQVDRLLTPGEERRLALYVGDRDGIDDAEQRLQAWVERGCEAASGVETFYDNPDAVARQDATATMLFNAWIARVVQDTWDDEDLPFGLFWRHDQTRVQLLKQFLEARDGTAPAPASLDPDSGESVFFDDLRTPEVESSREILLRAMVEALAFLRSTPTAPGQGGFGSDDPDAWLWGLRHQVRFESLLQSFLGDDPLFSAFTALFAVDTKTLPLADDLPPEDPRAGLRWFPRPGDNWGVDAANPGFSGTDYTYTDGPVMRMVFALKEGAVSGVNIIPGGQSGLTDSLHFADQARLWLGNQTLPLRFALADVIAGASGREVYHPE
jgi:penicillin G amidase